MQKNENIQGVGRGGIQKWIYVIVCVGVTCFFNPFTTQWIEAKGWIPPVPSDFLHPEDAYILAPLGLDIILLSIAAFSIFGSKTIIELKRTNAQLNIYFFVLFTFLLFTTNVLFTGRFIIPRLILIGSTLSFLVRAFYLGVIKNPKAGSLKKNLSLLLFSVGFIFFLLEGGFMFVSKPHRYNGTLASRNWFTKNWHNNNLGYRDKDIIKNNLQGKKVVMFLGDSFTAGHGVKNPSDRFSDKVIAQLPANYFGCTVALPGSDTRDELRELKKFYVAPDVVVLAYYPNDIQEAGKQVYGSIPEAKPYSNVPGVFRFFVRRSYFLNYLFWNGPVFSDHNEYLPFLKKCYSDPKTLSVHENDLQTLVSEVKGKNGKILFVLFPILEDVKGSGFALNPVSKILERDSVSFIDLREDLIKFSPKEMVVNANDGHPNEKIHELVSKKILEFLNQNKWLE